MQLKLKILFPVLVSTALCYEQFCRCQCDGGYAVIPLADEGCNACTRSFCESRQVEQCAGVEEDGFTTSCFQRESTKDQIIVYGFITLVMGLLVYSVAGAAIRDRLRAI